MKLESIRSLFETFRQHVRTDIFAPPKGQFDGMNGLRAFALFSVIAAHVAMFTGNISISPDSQSELSWFYRILNGGWAGLDFFFVLSGFLIGRILISSLSQCGGVQFRSFFIRRGMRVFPAYYLVLTLAVFWYPTLNLPYANFLLADFNWDAVEANAWQNYVYVMNYTFAVGVPNIMSWGWSLCVEEHFYLLLPPALVLIWRIKRPGWRAPLLIGLTLLPFAGRAIQYAINPHIFQQDGFYFRTHNRIDEILVGVVVAYFYVYHKAALGDFVRRMGSMTWVLGLGLVSWVWLAGGLQKTGLFAVVFQYHLMALGTALLILNLLFLDRTWVSKILAHRAWYPWARVSYGMYLLHTYVLCWLLQWQWLFPNPTSMAPWDFTKLYGVTVFATFLVSSIMFLSVER